MGIELFSVLILLNVTECIAKKSSNSHLSNADHGVHSFISIVDW